jgi:hypothetical protein
MGLLNLLSGVFSRPRHGVRWAPPDPAGRRAAIYQICYSRETFARLEPGFLRLDNRANQRPDWREYHPMRTFLQEAPLDEKRFYAFLSPKFPSKAQIGGPVVQAFLAQHADADVVLFSPFADLRALFLNSFMQGEYFHPGLFRASQAFLEAAGRDVDLGALVTDFRSSVACNYFAAKPAFWREWLALNEQLFRLAEGGGALAGLLTAPAPHVEGQVVPFKVFVQERTADLLLGTQPHWKVAVYPQSTLSSFREFSGDTALVMRCDALKAAYRDGGGAGKLREYHELLSARGVPPGEDPAMVALRARAAAEG